MSIDNGPVPNRETRLAEVIAAARTLLEQRVREINDLNVYPVADGDTGTNMLMTVQAIETAVSGLAGTSTADRCEAIARAALRGARGNSGMILSQMVRGAADVISDAPVIDGPAIAQALRGASDTAYRSVPNPVEGTMLTVIRGLADGAESSDTSGIEQVLTAALTHGKDILDATIDMLPELKEAGVVDSGAYGVLSLVEGLAAGLAGHDVGPAIAITAPAVIETDHEPSAFRYCTSFVLEDATIELAELQAQLDTLGDSLLVMGDRRQAKIHLHTDEPQRAIGFGEAAGVVSDVNVDDMHRQEEARVARLARRARDERSRATGALDPATPLTAENTAIVTDCGADLPAELVTENMFIAPIWVNFGTEQFHPGVTIDHEEFYARLAAGTEQPTTAAPSLGEFADVYARALERYENVITLSMNRKMSATVEVARRAALEVDPDRIVVIETESVSFQLGLLVRRAQARLERGTTLGEIEGLVDEFRRTKTCLFTVDTLEYLRRGGRIGRAKALVGNLLGLRPILEIAEGEITPIERVRGADKVIPAMRELLLSRTDADRPVRIVLGHSRNADVLPELGAMVRDCRPRAIIDMEAEIGPLVGTHAGPGVVALGFFHDPLDAEG
jgi:DegV family protein with EDD domain